MLFFSRQIGLSDAGQSIPILGGTRLTGRAGAYNIGVMNIQQRSTTKSLATNFTALRLRRDILANSDIGMVVLNKEATGADYNRVVGTDANFRFFDNLNISSYAARTLSPTTVVAGRGSDVIARGEVRYRSDFWDLRSSYLTVGRRVNDQLGFIERPGTNKFANHIGPRVRPKVGSGWLREINPHVEHEDFSYIGGPLQSRYLNYHLNFNLQDGSFIEGGANTTVENLIEPFTINRRRNISVAPGRYDSNEWFFTARSDASKALSFSGRWGVGAFYDGYRQNYALGSAVRIGSRLNSSLTVTRNQISLAGGRYSTDLVTARVEYGFSTMALVNALIQYNTDAREWSSNVRFNIIHHPLSDFFLVYNDRRDIDGRGLIDRAVIAKMTYMVAF
jgi:hypothetical protein